MHGNYSNQNKFDYLSDHPNQIYVDNDHQDISKHIQSLRTRLSFARFKLNNGWENNSIFDVESFWKKRQKKLMNNMPTPRFTQQDIIDRRFHYIKKRSKSCTGLPIKKAKKKDEQETFYFYHHYDKDSNNMIKSDMTSMEHARSSFNASYVPSDENCEPAVVKNSLDYLSYAIALTENRQHSEQSLPILSDGDDEEDEDIELGNTNDWTKTSDLRLSLSIPNNQEEEEEDHEDITSTNVAAQAMLMFVNRPSP